MARIYQNLYARIAGESSQTRYDRMVHTVKMLMDHPSERLTDAVVWRLPESDWFFSALFADREQAESFLENAVPSANVCAFRFIVSK